MEHHVGEGGVHGGLLQGQVGGIAAAQLDAVRSGGLELGSGGVQHRLAVVHGDDAHAQPGQLQGQDAGSGAHVADPQLRRHQACDRAGAQRIVVEDLAQGVPLGTDAVEPRAGAVRAFGEHLGERRRVALGGRVVAPGASRQLPGVAPDPIGRSREAVVHERSVAPVAQQSDLAQDGEMARHARLGHAQHAHQLPARRALRARAARGFAPGSGRPGS